MKLDYPKIKKFLQIGIFSIDLLVFLLVLFSTNSSSPKYKEYTDSSKFFLDLYIIGIYAILILVTIYPRLIFYRIKRYILFIYTDKGKVIISFCLSLIYWFAKNKPQFVLGFILTITSIVLLIYEFFFHFVDNFLSSKGIEFSNKGKSTFDMNSLEKANDNNMKTPIASQNNKDKQNEVKDSGNYDNNNTGGSNPENPPSDQIQRDVEISSGNNPNGGNQGFGF